jgi:hypothetical protein
MKVVSKDGRKEGGEREREHYLSIIACMHANILM